MSKFNIVILNWNGWTDTLKCIKSIHNNSKSHNYTIYLVDNGSEAEEINLIEKYIFSNFTQFFVGEKDRFLNGKITTDESFENLMGHQKIVFIKNNENLGFARGNNIALNYLHSIGEKLVVLLNNDTEIGVDALNKMVHFYNHQPNVGAVVPQIRYYNPKDIIWNCGGMLNGIGVRKYDYAFCKIDKVPQSGYKKIDYGTGCAILFDIQKVGLLTEKYFFGEEDMEFAFRLKKKNLPIFCIYNAVIMHKVGASRGQISKNEVGKMVYHYCQRMSNLKDNLTRFNYCISLLAHMASSIRLLINMRSFKLSTFLKCWKVILNNVDKKQFTLQDFKNISNQTY